MSGNLFLQRFTPVLRIVRSRHSMRQGNDSPCVFDFQVEVHSTDASWQGGSVPPVNHAQDARATFNFQIDKAAGWA